MINIRIFRVVSSRQDKTGEERYIAALDEMELVDKMREYGLFDKKNGFNRFEITLFRSVDDE